jgi:hypothetical protein
MLSMEAGMSLFYSETPLVINPGLVRVFGLNEAILLQQLHYWLEINRKAQKNFYDGYTWTYNTYQDWGDQFFFWSIDTIKRTIRKLENAGVIVAGNYNKMKIDRTKWYRINYLKVEELQYKALGQNAPMDNGLQNPNSVTLEQSDNIEQKPRNNPLGQNALMGDEICPKGSEQISPTNNQRLTEITTEITTEEIEEEEETKIAEGEREILYINNLDGEPESNDTNPFSNPEIVYEEPPGLQKTLGSNSEDLIESVKKKLGIEDTLAFLLVARCRDKLDKVIDQLTNAKKPIKNMTAYLLTLMSRPDQWDLFMENIENEFLTRERPKKKKREVKHKYLEEDREIYIPPSARNG